MILKIFKIVKRGSENNLPILYLKGRIKDIIQSLGNNFTTNEKTVDYLAKSVKDDNNNWNWKIRRYFYNEKRAKI